MVTFLCPFCIPTYKTYSMIICLKFLVKAVDRVLLCFFASLGCQSLYERETWVRVDVIVAFFVFLVAKVASPMLWFMYLSIL